MASLPLILDEDVRPLLAEVLRERGYDAIHVFDVDRGGMTDAQQLTFAISRQRAILTHNVKDFVLLDQAYRKMSKEHFGIILSKQIPFGELLRRTLKFLSQHHSESAKNNVFWLTD